MRINPWVVLPGLLVVLLICGMTYLTKHQAKNKATWMVRSVELLRDLDAGKSVSADEFADVFGRVQNPDSDRIRIAAEANHKDFAALQKQLRGSNLRISFAAITPVTEPKPQATASGVLPPANAVEWACWARYGQSASYQQTHDMSRLTWNGQ